MLLWSGYFRNSLRLHSTIITMFRFRDTKTEYRPMICDISSECHTQRELDIENIEAILSAVLCLGIREVPTIATA